MTQRRWWALVVSAAATGAAAQQAPQPQAPEPAPAQASGAAAAPGQPESLDELLGLEEAPADRGEKAPAPDRDLQRELSDEDVSEAFTEAVALMRDVSQRLSDDRDPGLGTQRTQEEILRKLDALMEQARQNASRSKPQRSSSSSSSSASPAGRQQSQQQSRPARGGTNQGETTNPGAEAAQPRALEPAASAAWGNLPAHVRDSLVQGLSEKFSSMYRGLTETYYRRLAEDPAAERAAPAGGDR